NPVSLFLVCRQKPKNLRFFGVPTALFSRLTVVPRLFSRNFVTLFITRLPAFRLFIYMLKLSSYISNLCPRCLFFFLIFSKFLLFCYMIHLSPMDLLISCL